MQEVPGRAWRGMALSRWNGARSVSIGCACVSVEVEGSQCMLVPTATGASAAQGVGGIDIFAGAQDDPERETVFWWVTYLRKFRPCEVEW